MIDELGLTFALRWLAGSYEERSGIQVLLEASPDLGRFKPDIEMTLFRIAQESLSNVYRRSGTPKVIVRVLRSSDEVVLEVADRGKGMPSSSIGSRTSLGIGIPAIEARVRDLNGRFDLESSPDSGVMIRVALPLT
jgi:signal transduction histidine kinase